MHLTTAAVALNVAETVMSLATKMPEVKGQGRSIRFQWVGQVPAHAILPIPKLKLRVLRDDIATIDDSPIKSADFGPLALWLQDKQTFMTQVMRSIVNQDEDDAFEHAAWLVSGDAPMESDDPSHTELYLVCVSDPIMERTPDAQVMWIQELLNSVEDSKQVWDYGYIESAGWSESSEGDAYSNTMGHMLKWRQQLEYSVWQAYGMLPSQYKFWRERYPVKGVFWGNYLGPSILKRIGGAERLKAYIDERCKEDPRNGWYRDMPGGAIFLALSDRVSDAQYELGGDPPERAMVNAVWLWSVLREANVMI